MVTTLNAANEAEVRLAARIYEVRDTVKMILGDQYAKHMKVHKAAIKAVAKVDNLSTLAATLRVIKSLSNPDGAIFILAAAAEIIEPSTIRVSSNDAT